jgi:hypothetical protein
MGTWNVVSVIPSGEAHHGLAVVDRSGRQPHGLLIDGELMAQGKVFQAK